MQTTELTEADARLVCSWRYPAPYDVYDHPDYEAAAAQGWAIADPAARPQQFRAVRDHGKLLGFSRLFQRDGRWLLGVGMEPSRMGHGLGHDFMGVVLADARSRHEGPLELEIRSFNTRALATYRRLGFREVGRRSIDVPGGRQEVIVMTDGAPTGRNCE